MISANRNSRVLGISVGERSMLVAEVTAGPGGQSHVAAAGEFRYPDDQSLADGERLGAAFERFLKEGGFGARTAVFGVPARWVLAKRKEIPATADDRVIADTLRLQAEGEFSPELNDLVFEYAGRPGGSASAVLLLALPRRQVQQLEKLAEAARLRLRAVTPTAAALAAATVRPSQDALVLVAGPGGIDLAAGPGGQPRALRYVGSTGGPAARLSAELRRATAGVVTAASSGGAGGAGGAASPAAEPAPREITIWGGAPAHAVGAADDPLRTAGQSLGLAVRAGSMTDLGVQSNGTAHGPEYAAAVSLALAGISSDVVPADFAHSRLAPPVERRVERRTVLAIAAAAVIVLGLGYWAYSLYARQSAIDASRAQLDAQKSQRTQAQAVVSRIAFAQRWHATQPRYIACLRDLTVAGIDPGQLYGTGFDLHEDSKDPARMSGAFWGKAQEMRSVLGLQDRLKKQGRFSDVTLVQSERRASAQKDQHEIDFRIGFVYTPPVK